MFLKKSLIIVIIYVKIKAFSKNDNGLHKKNLTDYTNNKNSVYIKKTITGPSNYTKKNTFEKKEIIIDDENDILIYNNKKIKHGNMSPENYYNGFKKLNKIEEREISFSPSLSRKNLSFKNVIKDNYQNINNNNIYINVVENFRSDYQNQNNNNNLNNLKNKNYENKCYTIKRILTEQDNLQKLMCHSHSQGFGKTIQRIFGNS